MKSQTTGAQKGLLILSATVLLFLTFASSANAAALVYRLEFSRAGDAVNDPRPRFGYLFVDSETGNASTIIVLIDPVTRNAYYTTGLITGQYFQATPFLRRRSPVDVVTGGSGAGGGDFAALQISGAEQRFFSVGLGRQVRLAPFLTGYLLLSGPDTESEILPLTAEQIAAQFGFVGYSKVEARFQRTATRSFGNREIELAEIITFYTEQLEAIGIESGSSATPDDPSPNPSPSPLPGPSPSPSPGASPSPSPGASPSPSPGASPSPSPIPLPTPFF